MPAIPGSDQNDPAMLEIFLQIRQYLPNVEFIADIGLDIGDRHRLFRRKKRRFNRPLADIHRFSIGLDQAGVFHVMFIHLSSP